MDQPPPTTAYDQRYSNKSLYWGASPSLLCFEILKLHPPDKALKVLDMGCGEGKDAIFLARNGYHVTGVDASSVGLKKASARSKQLGLEVHFIHADINEYRLQENYDVIFSSGTLQYIKPHLRCEIIADYKNHTNPGGLHALHAFVSKSFIEKAPDAETAETLWRSGELMGLYHDWWIEWTTEEVKPCNSSGVAHWHAHNRIIARSRTVLTTK